MKPVLIIHKQIPHLVRTPADMYDLYYVETVDETYISMCHWKDDTVIYVKNTPILPNFKCVPVQLKKDFTCKLSDMAFYALKVYCIKAKLSAVSQAALQVHGSEQQQMWLKILGLLEPIFQGEWL